MDNALPVVKKTASSQMERGAQFSQSVDVFGFQFGLDLAVAKIGSIMEMRYRY